MADQQRPDEHSTEQNDELRHKSEGQGTHGAPTRHDVTKPSAAPLPEGNGATGKPAAFPSKP